MNHSFWKRTGALLLILTTLATSVFAGEVTLDIDYITITENNFVADTMDGVPAYYNLYGSTYYCSELIPRYYETVYGLDLQISDGDITVLHNDDIYFVETDSPKKGDIMYASAAARGKGYSHWSLVKSADDETVTCFEQNWSWNGQAGINRIIPAIDSCYTFYTMVSKTDNLPQGVGITGISSASSWAIPYIETATDAQLADFDVTFTETVDRQLFCQMAVNVAASYGQVALGDTAIEQALGLGLITNGESLTLSRQEAAIVAVRLLDLIGAAPEADLSVLSIYADESIIPSWSRPQVAQLTACGLMVGSNGNFMPTADLTVEQAVTLLVRVMENPNPEVAATEPEEVPETELVSNAAMDVVRLSGGHLYLAK